MGVASRADVAVIIATRNRAQLLQGAIASIRAQVGVDWELAVVDDHSDDGTWAWLSQQEEETISVAHQPRAMERSAARNRGMRMTTAPAILFLDDDDGLAPDALARLTAALQSEPGAVLAAGARRELRGGRLGRRNFHPKRVLVRDACWDMLLGWSPGTGQVLFSRSAVEEVGGHDEGLSVAEDRDLLLRVAALGPAVLIPDSVGWWLVHEPPTCPYEEALAAYHAVDERFVLSLEPESRARAKRLLRGQALWRQASLELGAGQGLAAAGSLLGAVREAPEYASSPIFRRRLAYQLLLAIRRTAIPQPLWTRLRELLGAPQA